MRNRSCSASAFAYSYTFLHNVVCLSICRLSHSCTLLKLFDGFWCHLAGTLAGSNDTLCYTGPRPHRRRGRFGASNPQPKHAIADCSQTLSPMLPHGEYKRGAIPPFAELSRSLLHINVRKCMW